MIYVFSSIRIFNLDTHLPFCADGMPQKCHAYVLVQSTPCCEYQSTVLEYEYKVNSIIYRTVVKNTVLTIPASQVNNDVYCTPSGLIKPTDLMSFICADCVSQGHNEVLD